MRKPNTENQIEIFSKHPEETFRLGEKLGKALKEGYSIVLFGTLGSGKTLLTQGIARGIGVPQSVYVTSPTFTLINEYPGRIPVYHVDLYRISEEDELVELGLDELLGSDGVIVIEWGEKLPERLLKLCNVDIELYILDAETRKIVVTTGYEVIRRAVEEFSS